MTEINPHQDTIDLLKGAVTTRPASKKKAKVKKAKPETKRAAKVKKAKKDNSGPCGCGCDGVAKGGGFLPGHDSRLAGAIKRVLAGRPFEGERELVKKASKSEHPALNTDHFRHLFDALKKSA